MPHARASLVIGCLGALLAPGSAAAADLYVKAATRTLFGDAAFGSGGGQVDLPEGFQDHQLRIDAALALSPDWTVFGQVTPVGFGVYGNETRGYFGGAELGVAPRLLAGPIELRVRALVGARPSSGALGAGTVDGTRFVVEPVVGTAWGGLGLGVYRGFEWGWLSAQLGARAFTRSELEPALEGFLQVGFRLGSSVVLDVHVPAWYALGDLEPVNVLGAGQTRYVGLGVGLEWWLAPSAALTVGADIGPFARANAVSPALSLGVALRPRL